MKQRTCVFVMLFGIAYLYAKLLYLQQFSKMPLPKTVDTREQNLGNFMSLEFPFVPLQ